MSALLQCQSRDREGTIQRRFKITAANHGCPYGPMVRVALLGAILPLVLADSAVAQGITAGQTVVGRPRPEVDALGIPAGGFMLFPSFGLDEEYDDNIFATQNNTADDFITVLKPAAVVHSNWNNHALNFFGSASIGRHISHSGEDYNDFLLGSDGRLDITHDSKATGGITYLDSHEDRSSPDDVAGKTPTSFSILQPQIGFSQRFGRFLFDVDEQLRQFNFSNVQSSTGATIDNGDRDRDEWKGIFRAGYEFIPGYQAFIRTSVNEANYDRQFDRSGFQRDSSGYEIAAGTAVDITEIMTGNIFAGFRSQDFIDSRLPTISGVGFGGDLTWNVTRLTTIQANLSRDIEPSTLSGASGFFSTIGGISADHELLRDLLLGVNFQYINDDFQGISRNDDNFNEGAYVKYLMNRYLHVALRYNRYDRSSNVPGVDFGRDIVMISLVGQP